MKLSAEQLLGLLYQLFPETEPDLLAIDRLDAEVLRLRMRPRSRHLRPGEVIAGPTLMELADTAAYLCILAHAGPVISAVTTSLHIDFLRRAEPGDLIADCALLKLGRRLAVVEVRIASDGRPDLVARASITYSLPPPLPG